MLLKQVSSIHTFQYYGPPSLEVSVTASDPSDFQKDVDTASALSISNNGTKPQLTPKRPVSRVKCDGKFQTDGQGVSIWISRAP